MSTWSLREWHSALGLGLYVQRFGVLVHSPRPRNPIHPKPSTLNPKPSALNPKPSTPDFSASEFSRGKPTSSFGKRFPSSVPWPYAFLTSRNHGASTPDFERTGSGCQTVRALSLGWYSHSPQLSPWRGILFSAPRHFTDPAEADSRGNLRYLKSARLTQCQKRQHGPRLWHHGIGNGKD